MTKFFAGDAVKDSIHLDCLIGFVSHCLDEKVEVYYPKFSGYLWLPVDSLTKIEGINIEDHLFPE